MIDLSIIQEAQTLVRESVEQYNDELYFKQQCILEQSRELGFDYDELISEYTCFQESAATPPSIPKDLNMYKFDNKHIIKAIEYFNKGFDEIPENEDVETTREIIYSNTMCKNTLELASVKKVTGNALDEYFKEVTSIIKKPDGFFQKGFNELKEQFDCKFDLTYVSTGKMSMQVGTNLIENKPSLNATKINISKTKGFQLNGLSIKLILGIKNILITCPARKAKVFGQYFVSTILHEIFHNIAHTLDVRNSKFTEDTKDILESIQDSDSFGSSSAKLSNFVDKAADNFNIKKSDIKNKKRAVTRLYILSKIKGFKGAINKFKNAISKDEDPYESKEQIEAYIKGFEKTGKISKTSSIMAAVAGVMSILGICFGIYVGGTVAVVAGAVGLAASTAFFIMKAFHALMYKITGLRIGKISIREEYYCDLFAAMYQLPITFNSYKKYLHYSDDKVLMTRVKKALTGVDEVVVDPHPLRHERTKCSYDIAKKILESNEKIDPSIRKYLEYIVDENKGIENISGDLSKKQAKKLDPKAAEDLNRLINLFAKKTGATITESFVYDSYGGI